MAKSKGIPTPKGKSYEKPTAASSSILKRLWKYLMRHRMLIALAIMLSIAANLLALIGPKLSGYALDAINPGAGKVDFPTIFHYASLMIVFYLLSSVLNYFLRALMIRISRNVVTNMRQDVYDHMMSLPVSFFDRIGTGQLLSVLSYDIDTINASLSNDLVQVLASLITVIGSFLMMMTISPLLVLIFVFTIPISIIITKSRSSKARKLYRNRSASLGELNSFSEEMMGGLKTIKAYHMQDVFCERFDQANVDACQANYEADAFSAATGPMINFINNLSLALISIFGAVSYMNGSVSLGDVSSFVLYSRKFSGPINEFSNIISELQSALAAAERVFRLLDEPSEPADDASAIPFPKEKVIGQVDINDVSFGYIEGQTVLSGINLSVKSGQTVAVVGPTGTGKTTLINLLMRFYDITEGQILIDGHDIRTYVRADLRKAFAMVLQDTWLFSGTIYDNIAYGNENVTREQVIEVAKAAKINRLIQSLPQGYDTLLDDCGTNISKGQKQLLTIARAMLLDAPMLILDEATSNVDTQTERSIQAAMLKLMQGRTCFVIAHRLSTIRDADLIAVMQDGRIVESGTHSELINSKGVYFELYKAQFDRVDQLVYA